MVKDKICGVINKYVGLDSYLEELQFNEDEFNELCGVTEWDKAQAWCTYYAELVWKLAFKGEGKVIEELDTLFSAGSMPTWNQFRRSEWITSDSPRVGAIAIWQTYESGKPLWSGFSSIIEDIQDVSIQVVEGAVVVNPIEVKLIATRNTRLLNGSVKNGLRYIGCIYPEKVGF